MTTFFKFKRPLHLIIDGADGTGKTTVCEKLSIMLDLPVIKMPNMKKYSGMDMSEEFSALFNATISQFRDSSFIMDRGFPSSLVYGKVFGRTTINHEAIELVVNELNPTVVILTASELARKGRLKKDEYIPLSAMNGIDKEYFQLAVDNDYLVIDTSTLYPLEVCNKIINALSSEQE